MTTRKNRSFDFIRNSFVLVSVSVYTSVLYKGTVREILCGTDVLYLIEKRRKQGCTFKVDLTRGDGTFTGRVKSTF